MPSSRKRLQLTLSDEAWALIEEVHALTGTPKSAIVSELLDEILPAISAQLEALRKLSAAPREAQALINEFAEEAFGKLAQSQLDLEEALTKHEKSQQALPLESADGRTVKGRRLKKGVRRGAP